jgi:ferredoxin
VNVWLASIDAAQRFPPPDFESGHSVPVATTPPPDASWLGVMDVAVLIVALGLASYLVLQRRSRRGVFALAIGSLIYFGFWRKGCICAIGSIQNVSLALFDSSYALPVIAAAFFALPLVTSLFFGRTFCAAVCPLGAIQEMVAVKPVQVPAWIDRPLGLLRHVYLAGAVLFAATGSAFIICEYDPFVGFFRRNGSLGMLLFGAALLILGIFVVRPYCRYLCPYGVLLGWLSRASKWHARIDPKQCINCHLCAHTCPVAAIEPADEDSLVQVTVDKGRRRFGAILLLAPLLVIAVGALGYGLSDHLARLHFDVALAERVAGEEAGRYADMTDASESFRATGEPVSQLFERGESVRATFRWGAMLAGAFIGLAFAVTFIQTAATRRPREYEIDRARCVACARCFRYCPHDPHHEPDSATT